MKCLWWLLLPVFLLPVRAADGALPAPSQDAPLVYVIPVRDDIMPPLLYVVRRGIKEAMSADADAVILDMETNGGRVDTTEELIEVLDRYQGLKVTWVNRKAFSAGAFISVATQKIYMAPKSVIGAAAPIPLTPGGMGVDQIPDTMEVKMTSAISALIRAHAEQNGHDTKVIEAMIDKGKSLEIDGEILCREGELLTLTYLDAQRRFGPQERPLLSLGTVATLEELLGELDMAGARVVRVEPTGSEQLGAWINRISPILLVIGLVGLYLEFKTPGFGLPGIIGLSAFALYFLGGYIAGLSSIGWGALFILGLLLVLVEIMLIPGTLLAGVIGAVLMVGAILMALVDWDPTLPTYPLPTPDELATPLLNLGLAATISLGIIMLLSRYLPRMSIYHQIVPCSTSGTATQSLAMRNKDEQMGLQGKAITPLHPGGKARFGDRVLDVVTQGEMLEAGTRVVIIGTDSLDPVVARS